MDGTGSEGRPRRVDVRVPVDILCSKGIRLTGKTRNVSEGGMFVETALLLPVGSPVRCDLALTESAVEVFGRIAWSRPRQPFATAGMGIQFVGYEEGARRVLHDVVEHAASDARLVLSEITAQTRIERRAHDRLILAALFLCVALATAAAMLAILPGRSRGAPPAEPAATAVSR
jgi:uncharacterized protein (TIGR02266 family)